MTVEGRRVAVVVPAFNEASLVGGVLRSMPPFVDEVIVVDDGSEDDTADAVLEAAAGTSMPVALLRHATNRGVGAALRTGYRRALADGMDVVAVMAGDGQMDPADLERVVSPVARGENDYVKGNRLGGRGRPEGMPWLRYLGSAPLALATRLASGYQQIADPQSGYTAISGPVLRALPLARLHPTYGYPNHVLIMLGQAGRRVGEVPVRPVYGRGETSGIRPLRDAPPLLLLLARGWLARRRATGDLVAGRLATALRLVTG